LNWPEGIKDVEKKFEKSIKHENMKEVKVQMVVGEEDNVVHGGDAFWEWAGKMKGKSGDGEGGQLARMRVGRLETLRELCEEWRAVGVEVRFDVVPGVAHDSSGVLESFLKFLEPLITPSNER
jgi:alkanesulfonate monooxygenase SsuD/methylene tetrahydromethanopterin reductase-like flavin-dependent oxidoreductase (luciferase family)